MNLGKVKSFLIVLFLGINIYLILSMHYSTRFTVDNATRENCVKLLEERGITLDVSEIPEYTVNLKNIDTNNIIHSKIFLKNGSAKISGNKFSIPVKAEDFSGENSSSVKNFLKSLGFNTSYMNIKYSDTKKAWYVTCKVGGYRIFDNIIKISQIPGHGAFLAEGTWYEPSTNRVQSRSRTRNTMYITSVLLDMTQNESIMKNAPFEITDISYGYLAGKAYGKASHVTSAALPYYRIKDNHGNVYYFDAQSGTYLEN